MVHILNLLISLAPLFLSAIATVDVEILQKRTAAPKACLPAVHGKLFQVRAVSDDTLFWTMRDCLQAKCTSLALSTNSRSTFNKWYAGTKKSGSTPPYELSIAANRGGFCIDSPAKNGGIRGNDCAKGELDEGIKFECASCSTSSKSGTVFGTSCTAMTTEWSQCFVGHGIGNTMTLGICNGGHNKRQLFDLIVT